MILSMQATYPKGTVRKRFTYQWQGTLCRGLKYEGERPAVIDFVTDGEELTELEQQEIIQAKFAIHPYYGRVIVDGKLVLDYRRELKEVAVWDELELLLKQEDPYEDEDYLWYESLKTAADCYDSSSTQGW